MEQYKPNSHKYKQEQAEAEEKKKLEKVISGTAKVKKKGGLRKIADNFISEDAPTIKTYIVKDVIIPTIKRAISDTIDMILYGGTRKSRTTNASKVSYRSYYDDPRPTRDPAPRAIGYDYSDIIIDDRGEAEYVLDQMGEIINTYGIVSVADLYDLVGITGSYTDNKYGWTSLGTASVERERGGGYSLRLPKPLAIK